MTLTDTPQIYVACLAAYNQGIHHGVWIDATEESDEMMDRIDEMLKTSPFTEEGEWAIHDYSGFEQIRIREHESLDRVQELAVFVEEHGELGSLLLVAIDDLEAAKDALADDYSGVWGSLKDYAAETICELYDVPKALEPYIDYERFGRDLEMGGDILTLQTSDGKVHVFNNL